MISSVISTSLSVVREKERGTMEQVRMAPLGTGAYIIGKTLPYFVISLATSVFIVLASMVLFGLPMNGSWLLLILALSLYLAGALGLGLMISTIAESQQVAFQLAVLASFLPTMMLSGFVFPIASMPAPIQAITFVVPARYFIVALRSIVLKGAELSTFWTELAALARVCGGDADAGLETAREAMGMRSIWFVMWKEVIELRQDPRIFGIIFIAPVLQLAILGYAATTDVRNVPIVVVDADRSPASQDLISRFTGSGIFELVDVVSDAREVDRYLESGDAWMALSIPAQLRRERRGRPPGDAAGRRRRIGRELDEHRDGVRDQPDRRLRAGDGRAARAPPERRPRRRAAASSRACASGSIRRSRAATSCCRAFSRCCCWS